MCICFLLDVYLVVDIKITNICTSIVKEYIYVHYELKLLMYNISTVFLKKHNFGGCVTQFQKTCYSRNLQLAKLS